VYTLRTCVVSAPAAIALTSVRSGNVTAPSRTQKIELLWVTIRASGTAARLNSNRTLVGVARWKKRRR
jgi:hypothetical protein